MLCFLQAIWGQSDLQRALKQFNSNSVPYITVEELKEVTHPVLLDAREKPEFKVSHLKNALWVGYQHFKLDIVTEQVPDKSTPIVVYCSIGVRSEDIGEKLLKAGYTDVKNLYGGIFEWKNKGNPVVDKKNDTTEKIHAYSKHWGRLLTKGEKVY